MEAFVLVRSLHSGEVNLVWSGTDYVQPLKAADVRAILGDRVPVIAYDDSAPDGRLRFPLTGEGARLGVMLRDQLNDALRSDDDCPAESFPEPADFAEPPGGESARVEHEEAAHLDALRAKALLAPDAVAHHRYAGWAPGDRFIVLDPDDVARHAAALHLWPTWGCDSARGTVITRCDRHHDGHDVSAGLLIDCEGLPRPIVVSPRILSACAKKVTA